MIKLELEVLEYMHVLTCVKTIAGLHPTRQAELLTLAAKLEAQGKPQYTVENVTDAFIKANLTSN